MLARLKTSLWVSALLRRADVGGAYGLLSKKGDEDAGAVLVKICTLDGHAVLYQPAMNMTGERIWLPDGPAPERDIDAKIRSRLGSDPDLWVVEIEDKQGRHFLTDPIETQKGL